MPIPQDWDGLDWECFVIEWPASLEWRAILLGFLTTPTRGRFWDERTGQVIDVQEVGREIEDRNCLTQPEGSMNCITDLVVALNGIRAAIYGTACCSSTGPTFVSDGEGGVWYGTEEPIDRPVSFGESGDEFETEAEFKEHLCLAANNIVAGLIMTLNNASIATLVSLIAGGIVVGIFVANPPLAILIALVVAGLATAAFRLMAEYIDDNREAWVCAIYTSTSYANMLVKIDTLISEMVIYLDLGAFEVGITDLIHSMLATDVLNKAYRAVGLPPVLSPIDCDVCVTDDCAPLIYATYGTINSLTDNEDGTWTIRITSEYFAGTDHERAFIRIDYDTHGTWFNFIRFDLVSGPSCQRARTYIRVDGTSGTGNVATPYTDDHEQIKEFQIWQSGTCSPGTSVYDIKVSCGFDF